MVEKVCCRCKQRRYILIPSLVPRPSHAFVACRLKMVKLIICTDVAGCMEEWLQTYVQIYSIGWFSEPEKRHRDCLMSTTQLLHNLYSLRFARNVPLLHVSTSDWYPLNVQVRHYM